MYTLDTVLNDCYQDSPGLYPASSGLPNYRNPPKFTKSTYYKKDGYRQRNVRQFLQSAYKAQFGYLISHAGMCRCLY